MCKIGQKKSTRPYTLHYYRYHTAPPTVCSYSYRNSIYPKTTRSVKPKPQDQAGGGHVISTSGCEGMHLLSRLPPTTQQSTQDPRRPANSLPQGGKPSPTSRLVPLTARIVITITTYQETKNVVRALAKQVARDALTVTIANCYTRTT